MRELLSETYPEAVERYLIPLRKYLIRLKIKLQDQIKGRRATWLIGVREYLRLKRIYCLEDEEVIIHKKIKSENGNLVTKFYRRKNLYLIEHQRN